MAGAVVADPPEQRADLVASWMKAWKSKRW
jgi:hypothetical protein